MVLTDASLMAMRCAFATTSCCAFATTSCCAFATASVRALRCIVEFATTSAARAWCCAVKVATAAALMVMCCAFATASVRASCRAFATALVRALRCIVEFATTYAARAWCSADKVTTAAAVIAMCFAVTIAHTLKFRNVGLDIFAVMLV